MRRLTARCSASAELSPRAQDAPLRARRAPGGRARRQRLPLLLAGRGTRVRRDRARRAGRGGARRALRPDGRLPPLARRVPAASGRGVPPRLDPGFLRARHRPARSRGAAAPGAARLQDGAPLRPPLRRVRVARAGPRPGSGRGRGCPLDAARGRPPPAAAPAGAAHGGRARRRQPARPVALGAAPGRGVGDRREGALEEAARRPRRGAAASPGGADRRGGRNAGPGDREAARGLAFDVVFVPGLAEKLFPRKIVEDPILLDPHRRALEVPALATQPARVGAERLALRLAVGAARERVVLSWPRVDIEQARPRVPSFYGLEALRAASGRLPGFDELEARGGDETGGRLGWPAPGARGARSSTRSSSPP